MTPSCECPALPPSGTSLPGSAPLTRGDWGPEVGHPSGSPGRERGLPCAAVPPVPVSRGVPWTRDPGRTPSRPGRHPVLNVIISNEMSPRVTKDNVRCCVVAKSGCGWREVMAPCGDSATRLSSREVTSDVTARPGPGRPGPKSRTGHGWLVQGAVWSPGLRPRLALRRGDLGLLHGAPAECACRWRPRAGAGSMRALSREVWCRLNPADASPWVV